MIFYVDYQLKILFMSYLTALQRYVNAAPIIEAAAYTADPMIILAMRLVAATTLMTLSITPYLAMR